MKKLLPVQVFERVEAKTMRAEIINELTKETVTVRFLRVGESVYGAAAGPVRFFFRLPACVGPTYRFDGLFLSLRLSQN